MKNKIILICLIQQMVIISCTTGIKGKYTSYINNSTTHKVALKFYKSGKLVNADSRDDVIPNSITMVLVTPGDDLSIYPERISVYDSVVIHFDTLVQKTHYGAVSGMNPLALIYSNERNIFNKKNWIKKVVTDTKKRQESEYTYTITQEDYLNAKM